MGNLKGLRHPDSRGVVVGKNTERGSEARWSRGVAAGLDDCPLRTHGLRPSWRAGRRGRIGRGARPRLHISQAIDGANRLTSNTSIRQHSLPDRVSQNSASLWSMASDSETPTPMAIGGKWLEAFCHAA